MRFKTSIFAVLFVLTLGAFVACSSDGIAEDKDTSDTGGGEINAYILKIDGVEVGYLSSAEEIARFEEILTEDKINELKSSETEVVRVSVNSSIESEETLCSENELMSAEEIASRYYENGGRISFSVTVNERETKYISFETVYTNSSSYYEGTKVVKTAGENGERELVYEVTYVDGEESERELVSDTVTRAAVNEVVLVGTKKSTASTGSYRWPLSSVTITSSYGSRYLSGTYDFHLGVDLRASSGTSVYAADGGKVTYAGWLGSYGYIVKLQHDNGDYTYYAHLSKINVSVGSRVYKGQIIARSGATGNVTGAHLHFEVRKNGSTVNPVNYLPSLRNVTIAYSAFPESCGVQTGSYQFHSALPASSYSKREQEEYL